MSKTQNKTETKKYNLNIIWSFAEKEQFMTDVQVLPDNCRDISEVCFIKNIILNEFTDDLHLTEDLYKISMAFDCPIEEAMSHPVISKVMRRMGKYYFNPTQRDEVEDAIVRDSMIASKL